MAKIEIRSAHVSVSEILRVFANTLTADEQYSLCNSKNLLQATQLPLSKKKIFLNFFAGYLKPTSNFEHFEKKKMTLIGYVFLKLVTAREKVS